MASARNKAVATPAAYTLSTPSDLKINDRIATKAQFINVLTDRGQMDQSLERIRPRTLGIHHLKFVVSNLDVSIAWYERVLGARRIPNLDHVRADGTRFAVICEMIDWSGLFLELRQSNLQASRERGCNPVILTVRGRQDLMQWIDWLDRWGTTHSPLLTGIRGWLLVFEDPDGRRIRIYTREDHGGRMTPSNDDHWLSEP